MQPGLAIVVLWVVFAVSWLLAAAWSRKPERRLGLKVEIPYRILLILGGLLFLVPAHGYEGRLRLWHVGWTGAWICVALIALAFAFNWWARVHLGPLWSGTITKKPDHRIVDTGPYAIVRHPIYTGFLLAILATAAAKGTILGVIAALMLAAGIWMKARLEEGWLSAELGPGYDAYRRRVPMLVPFGPHGG
jgi:protein-S-isoprenylcysteine O-methyltransferase Ste14